MKVLAKSSKTARYLRGVAAFWYCRVSGAVGVLLVLELSRASPRCSKASTTRSSRPCRTG